jgi:hypothetical protein
MKDQTVEEADGDGEDLDNILGVCIGICCAEALFFLPEPV